MVIGVNLPDEEYPLPDMHWARIRMLPLNQITISSRAHRETLEQLSAELPDALIHVRSDAIRPDQCEFSPVLDYRSTDHSGSLGECLEILRSRIPAERLFWVGGSELSSNEQACIAAKRLDRGLDADGEAIQRYAIWWREAAGQIKRQFPAVQIAVAPLGQGDPDRQWRWFRMLKRLGCYEQATYLADHNAFINRPFADREWGSRGIALRELLPELGLVHNLQAHDGGFLTRLGDRCRAEVYAKYLNWCADNGSYACVSLVLPDDSADSCRHTLWSSLPSLILHRSAEAADPIQCDSSQDVTPPIDLSSI